MLCIYIFKVKHTISYIGPVSSSMHVDLWLTLIIALQYFFSQNGGTKNGIYSNWFKEIFIQYTSVNNPSGKHILLIIDGHKSHEISKVNISILTQDHPLLPPSHMTHNLQPLDVSVFNPLQNTWGHWCWEAGIQGRLVLCEMFIGDSP